MKPESLEKLLVDVADGKIKPDEAARHLERFVEEPLGYATLDAHRALRQGAPEVVMGEFKTAPQIVGILKALADREEPLLVTRVDPEKAAAVIELLPLEYHPEARALTGNRQFIKPRRGARIAIVTAGTSDQAVAEEAALTATFLGMEVDRYYDIGVAGLHRLLSRLDAIRAAGAVIVVAGMEGALPSVVGGLVAQPVIAVPTSVGYGVSRAGFAALLGMLSSCAAGVTVVNIDNGFGAAFAAFRILKAAQDHATAD